MSGSVPGYGKTLTTEELVALRKNLGMGEAEAGTPSSSSTTTTTRERLPTLRSLRMRRLVFPPATVADPQGRLFAVVSVKGKQFKVSPGDVINAEKYKGVKVGEVLPVRLPLGQAEAEAQRVEDTVPVPLRQEVGDTLPH